MASNRGLVATIVLLGVSGLVLLVGGRGEPVAQGSGLVALAAVAGVLATGGVARRLVGGVIAAIGLIAAWQGDSIAVRLGALLLVIAGGLTCWYGDRWRALGSRYQTTDTRPGQASDMWTALDRGEDPTV